ncbi:MAG: TerC/Alx family metal homeostasis membrane protein [Chloroflexota bacterium]
MSNEIWLWVGFNIFVLAMLALDLGVFHRKAEVIKMREALIWSAAWIVLALAFNVGLYLFSGAEIALAFTAGYLIERALSVDNIFVFILIFAYFRVPAAYQYRVLFWGILGALVMRALLIAAGITLIERFHWMIYVFGAFLIFTGIKMLQQRDKEIHPEKNPVLRLFRRLMPVSDRYEGQSFFVRHAGRLVATPLFVVLLVVETTDVVFALDSIPAILAVTRDPFLVYSSNVFAILGLRALYFAVAGLMQMFRYLDYGLSAVLVFVGAKMLISDYYKMPIEIALGAVAAIIGIAILASIVLPRRVATMAGERHSEPRLAYVKEASSTAAAVTDRVNEALVQGRLPMERDFVHNVRGAVLVGVDGSPSSHLAAKHAVDLAKRTGAPLLAIHVVDSRRSFKTGVYYRLAMKDLRTEGSMALAAVEEVARQEGVKVSAMQLLGSPADTLIKIAQLVEAKVLVLGTSSTSRLGALLWGSTLTDVLTRNTPCPTYVAGSAPGTYPWRPAPMPDSTLST